MAEASVGRREKDDRSPIVLSLSMNSSLIFIYFHLTGD